MSEAGISNGLVTRLGAVPIADGALMTKMLRDALVQYAESGVDVAEHALLGLLAIVGALEDRLAHHEPAPSLEATS